MNFELRHFQMEDVDSIVTLWNQELPFDQIQKNEFLSRIVFDPNFDPHLFQIAYIQEKIIGFIYGIKRKIPYLEKGLEPHRAWIVMMAVQHQYQHQSVGTILLKQIEALFTESGIKKISLCNYSPNYFTPGIDLRYKNAHSFFKKHGYSAFSQAVSMEKNIAGYTLPDNHLERIKKLNEMGYSIIKFQNRYALKLLDFILKEFGGGWKQNALTLMQKGEAERCIFIAIDQHDQVVGFAMRKLDGNETRFGPFGVSSELRSMGIGGLLFEKMMIDMCQYNLHYLYFLWTNGDAQRFYERYDVRVYRSYTLYEKEVSYEI